MTKYLLHEGRRIFRASTVCMTWMEERIEVWIKSSKSWTCLLCSLCAFMPWWSRSLCNCITMKRLAAMLHRKSDSLYSSIFCLSIAASALLHYMIITDLPLRFQATTMADWKHWCRCCRSWYSRDSAQSLVRFAFTSEQIELLEKFAWQLLVFHDIYTFWCLSLFWTVLSFINFVPWYISVLVYTHILW